MLFRIIPINNKWKYQNKPKNIRSHIVMEQTKNQAAAN